LLADTQVLRELVTAAVCEGTQGLLALERGVETRPLLLIAMPLKPAGVPDLEAGGTAFACGELAALVHRTLTLVRHDD
jgi:hypothetical protein